jgi:hypothetical protein
MKALIGNTGFVGGTLARQANFDALYASRNIDSIRGREFELIVCAGMYAEKWRANRDPVADMTALERLIDPLRTVKCERFVLISTVDVYDRPFQIDESVPADATHPYGRHRRLLEEFVQERFAQSFVLRLPGLFGPGLKKNIIFDLLNDHEVDRIHPDGVYQYYPLAHLWTDIQRWIPVLNVACEPIATRELALRCFSRELSEYPPGVQPGRYDFRTRHAPSGYLYDKATVLRELQEFVAAERAL